MKLKTSNDRLLYLADFLVTLPRERFNFHTWVGDDWKGAQDLSCGTTACALGWAATMPRFRKLGLRLQPTRYLDRTHLSGTVGLLGQAHDSVHPAAIVAACEIFGLDWNSAGELFALHTGEQSLSVLPLRDARDPREMAERIRYFVKHWVP